MRLRDKRSDSWLLHSVTAAGLSVPFQSLESSLGSTVDGLQTAIIRVPMLGFRSYYVSLS